MRMEEEEEKDRPVEVEVVVRMRMEEGRRERRVPVPHSLRGKGFSEGMRGGRGGCMWFGCSKNNIMWKHA